MTETIQVTIVGPSGSGKTVYLASLFRRLSQQRADVGFFTSIPFDQSQKLNRIYQQVASPERWPPPTRIAETPCWDFTCSVRSVENRVLSPYTVSYIDYAGEMLTSAEYTDVAEYEKVADRIRTADFLLFLLDGEKVLNFLKGDDELIDELIPVFSTMTGSNAVVHFVLTKWDLFDPAEHDLQKISDALCEHHDFRPFLEPRLDQGDQGGQAGQAGIVRLIPVSSVGHGFVTFDADGRMVKTGKRPVPLNVEIPFMAIVVDLFDRELARIKNAYDAEADQSGQSDQAGLSRKERQLRWFQQAKSKLPLARPFVQGLLRKTRLGNGFGSVLTDVFLEYAKDLLENQGQRIERDIAELRRAAHHASDDQEAMTALLQIFQKELARFEAEYPGTLLTRREIMP